MPLADGRRVLAEDHLRQYGAKALVEAEVDEEVHCRVGDYQRVADATEVELESAALARLVRQEVPRQLGDECRELTDAEDYDDHDQDQRDIVVVLLAGALHLPSLLVDVLQRGNETYVQHGQRGQRNDQHDDGVEHVAVDDKVHSVVEH